MAAQIDLLWIVSVLFCAWVGYRLAEYYGLNPVAGLTFGAAINVLFATDFGSIDFGVKAAEDVRILLIYFTILLCFSMLLLTGKRKAMALMKVGVLLTLIAMAFSYVPRGQEAPRIPGIKLPPGVEFQPIARADLPLQLAEGVRRSRLGFETMARVSRQTFLFHSVYVSPRRSSVSVESGTWVLIRRTITGRGGRTWVEVLLPDGNGDYTEGRSRVGFVPTDTLSFHIPVPTLAD